MEIISDMTRQFKSVEEELMNRINKLELRKENNTAEMKQLEETKKNLDTEINEIRSAKTEEISKLKKSIEEMSQEFAAMLKDTLEKMKTKIETANQKWEDENDGAMLKRFEDYAGGTAQKS